jgi:hypothetical protein
MPLPQCRHPGASPHCRLHVSCQLCPGWQQLPRLSADARDLVIIQVVLINACNLDAVPALGRHLGCPHLSVVVVGLLVSPVVQVIVLGGNGGGFAFALCAAYAFLQSRRKRNCTSLPCAFLRGVPSSGLSLGIPSLLTPPSSLAAHGGFSGTRSTQNCWRS